MQPVENAIALNNSFFGTTCHFVNEDVDAGEIICQGIFNQRKVENIYHATFECDVLTLINGVFELVNNKNVSEIKVGDYLICPAFGELSEELCNQIFEKLRNENTF